MKVFFPGNISVCISSVFICVVMRKNGTLEVVLFNYSIIQIGNKDILLSFFSLAIGLESRTLVAQ